MSEHSFNIPKITSLIASNDSSDKLYYEIINNNLKIISFILSNENSDYTEDLRLDFSILEQQAESYRKIVDQKTRSNIPTHTYVVVGMHFSFETTLQHTFIGQDRTIVG